MKSDEFVYSARQCRWAEFLEVLMVIRAAAALRVRSLLSLGETSSLAQLLYSSQRQVTLYKRLVSSERKILFCHLLGYIECQCRFPAARVLDLGCGPCLFASIAVTANSSLAVTCVDASPEMLREASTQLKNFSNIRIVQSDFDHFLRSDSNLYDVILCVAIGRFIQHPQFFFEMLAKRLDEGGIVIFRALKYNLRNSMRVLFWNILTLGLSSAKLELGRHLTCLLEQGGFVVEQIELPEPLCRNLIALKAQTFRATLQES